MSAAAQVVVAVVGTASSAVLLGTVRSVSIDVGAAAVLVVALAALARSAIRLASTADSSDLETDAYADGDRG